MIGKKIKEYREKNGLKQGEFAKKIGVHQSHLSDMESGKKQLGIILIRRLVKEYGFSVYDFFEDIIQENKSDLPTEKCVTLIVPKGIIVKVITE